MMWYERPENAGKVDRLKKMYKSTKNDEIMLKLDISFSALHRAARALGLTKSFGKEQKATQLNLFGNGQD